MKKMYSKIFSLIICVVLIFNISGCTKTETEEVKADNFDTYKEIEDYLMPKINENTAITLWYTDQSDEAYLSKAADEFKLKYNIQVSLNLYEGIDYLEDVNKANINNQAADIFILSNDQIRKANLAGLIDENNMYSDTFLNSNYPAITKNAITTDGNQYGYPIYFDTYFMVYNSELVEKAPATIEEILDFASEFEDEEGNKTIFKWNVADPYFDYMFIGKYANILGDFGEDKSKFDLTTDNSILSMAYYQSLSQYFSMNADSNNYSEIKKEIEDGTLIFSICKTDIVNYINSESSYKVAMLPNLNEELESIPASITYSAMVNDYSNNKEAANLFGAYLSYEYVTNQYSINYKVASRIGFDRTDENEILISNQYIKSQPMPKILEMGDFWTYSEIAFKNIWNGNDVETELIQLEENMMQRFK